MRFPKSSTIIIGLILSILLLFHTGAVSRAEVVGEEVLYLYYFETDDVLLLEGQSQMYAFATLPGEQVTLVVYGLDGLLRPEVTLSDSTGQVIASGQSTAEQPFVRFIEFSANRNELYTVTVTAVEADPQGGLARLMLLEGAPIAEDRTYLDTVNPLLPGRVFMVAGSDVEENGVVGLRTGAEVLAVDRFRQRPDIFVSRGSYADLPPLSERTQPAVSHVWYNAQGEKFYFFTVHALPEQVTVATRSVQYAALNLLSFFYFDYFFIIGQGSDPVLFGAGKQPCSQVTLANRAECLRETPNRGRGVVVEAVGVGEGGVVIVPPPLAACTGANTGIDITYSVPGTYGGSDCADTMRAGASINKGYILFGYGGDDVLLGSTGGDYLYGGVGNDWLNGQGGDDFVYGEAGYDVLVVEANGGVDTLDGGADYDTLDLSALNGVVVDLSDVTNTYSSAASGSSGSAINIEVLISTPGNDSVTGTATGETLVVNGGNDSIDAGAGNDSVIFDAGSLCGITANLTTGSYSGSASGTLSGVENLTGTACADSLTGDGNTNVLDGWAGHDVLNGMGGDDWLWGYSGNDVLDGGAGNDYLLGESGNDLFIQSDSGADALYGSSGRDSADYSATSGSHTFYVYPTYATVNKPGGVDYVSEVERFIGGSGNDTFYAIGNFANSPGNPVVLAGGAGADNIYFNSASGYFAVNSINQIYYNYYNTSICTPYSGFQQLYFWIGFGCVPTGVYVTFSLGVPASVSSAGGVALVGSAGSDVLDVSALAASGASLGFDAQGGSDTYLLGTALNVTVSDSGSSGVDSVVYDNAAVGLTVVSSGETSFTVSAGSASGSLSGIENVSTGAADDSYQLSYAAEGVSNGYDAGENSTDSDFDRVSLTSSSDLLVTLEGNSTSVRAADGSGTLDTLLNFESVTTGSGDDTLAVVVSAASVEGVSSLNAGGGDNVYHFVYDGTELASSVQLTLIAAAGSSNTLDFTQVTTPVTLDTSQTQAQEVWHNFWVTLVGVFEVVLPQATPQVSSSQVVEDEDTEAEPRWEATLTPTPEAEVTEAALCAAASASEADSSGEPLAAEPAAETGSDTPGDDCEQSGSETSPETTAEAAVEVTAVVSEPLMAEATPTADEVSSTPEAASSEAVVEASTESSEAVVEATATSSEPVTEASTTSSSEPEQAPVETTPDAPPSEATPEPSNP